MESITQIIERFAEVKPVEPPLLVYRCSQDNYDIYYVPSLGEATYKFTNGDEIDVDHLTEGQVEYYLKSGYWHEIVI